MGQRVARTVGRYEIVDELGRGGMATVYLARQADLDRLVALKELSAFRQSDPAFTRRFLRESRLAGSLSHPNIVTVHDYFEDQGTPYIAMEYVPRGSLRPQIGHMSLTQVAGVLEGMLAALGYAASKGVVHRDLKPENVMVTSEGRVKIADFGIAKATGRAQTSSVLTGAGMTVGTPNYMAPEQAMGRDVGPWTDLYSAGVMAFEFFVGRVPFSDTEEPVAVLMRQVNDPVPPAKAVNPEVDESISAWIERMLVKDPADRIQSAGEAWDELEEIVIELVGPRWRRSAALLEPSERPPSTPAGPATPPPTSAARPPLMPTWSVPNGVSPWDAPTRRLRDRDEDAALAETAMPELPTRRLEPEPRPRRFPPLLKAALALLALLVALAAALGGGGPAGSSGGKPALTIVVTGRDMSVRVPQGWRPLRRAPNLGLPISHAAAVAPGGRADGPVVEFGLVKGDAASNSTLLPQSLLASLGGPAGGPPRRAALRLPAQNLEAWRYGALRPVGIGRRLTAFTVPTSGGVATVACGAVGPDKAFAAQCDAIAGSLRLRTVTPYPVGPSNSYASALNGAIGDLQQTTQSQEQGLQQSQTLEGQAAAERALANAYETAASQLAALDLSPADRDANARLVTALRQAARAYRRAAVAAESGDAAAYRTASAQMPQAKARVNDALAGIRAAGYDSSGQKGAGPRSTAPNSAGPSAPAPKAAPSGGSAGSGDAGVGDSRSDDPSDDEEEN